MTTVVGPDRPRRRGCLAIILILVLGAAGLIYQFGVSPPAPPLATTATPTAINTLRVGLAGWGEINTLDPAKAATAAPVLVVWQVYDRLVRIGEDGELEPMLASRWSADEALQEWRFEVRGDAAFQGSEGPIRPVTANDVRASIERAIKIPGYGQSLLGDLVAGATDFMAGKAAHIHGLELEGNQVIVRLVRPFAFLPERLASSFFSIVPEETPADPSTAPPGSGPYRLSGWNPTTQTVELSKTPHPYGPHSDASPETIKIWRFQNEGVAIEELRAGTLDWLETTSTALPVLRSLEGHDGIAVELPSHTQVRLVALNQQRAKFRTAALGQALNHATNRSEILAILGGGTATPGPIPGSDYADAQLPYAPEKARQLIERMPPEARKLTMLVQPGEESKTIAELLRKDWERVGFTVSLQQGQADFFPRLVKGDYEMALAYYGPFLPTPEQYLWPYLASSQPIPNAMRYDSNAFDAAFDQYVSARTPAARDAHLRAAADILASKPPVVWVVKAPLVTATRGKLSAPRVAGTPEFYLLERR